MWWLPWIIPKRAHWYSNLPGRVEFRLPQVRAPFQLFMNHRLTWTVRYDNCASMCFQSSVCSGDINACSSSLRRHNKDWYNWKSVKYLWIPLAPLTLVPGYQRMADAISSLAHKTGKPPIRFALCEWGWVRHTLILSLWLIWDGCPSESSVVVWAPHTLVCNL